MSSQVPAGWRLVSLGELGNLATSSVDKLTSDDEQPVRLVNYMDVYSRRFIDRGMQFQVVTASKDEVVRFQVQQGDILFTPSSETPDDIGHSAVVVDALPDTVHSYHTVRLRVRDDAELDLRFRGWVANNEVVRRYLAQCATGSTRYTLSLGRLGSAIVALPPLAQQKRIAEILSTVDEAIEETEKLIAKHQQIKSGLMHDLFTRGLTPDGQLRPPHTEAPHLYKDSPLGPIPNEWEVDSAAKLTTKITKGTTPPDLVGEELRGFVPYIRVQNLSFDGSLDFLTDRAFVERSVHAHELARSVVYPGDILINIVGPPLGKVSLVPDSYPEWNINQAVAVFRLRDPGLSSYVSSFLLSEESQKWFARRAKRTSGQVNLTLQLCQDLPIPIPQRSSEFNLITDALRTIDASIHTERECLEKLRNEKRGLMSDLLTGKVDVAVPRESVREPSIPTADEQAGG